ncbi:hypothetical protein F4809DRAFT_494093 [Biscogniauxia mediterranea]|nr:hypothetical protein F4809DRAFT_494093 [Biscogniauxia mediterranea]
MSRPILFHYYPIITESKLQGAAFLWFGRVNVKGVFLRAFPTFLVFKCLTYLPYSTLLYPTLPYSTLLDPILFSLFTYSPTFPLFYFTLLYVTYLRYLGAVC